MTTQQPLSQQELREFGIVGDSIHDDADGIERLLNAGVILGDALPPATYAIGRTIIVGSQNPAQRAAERATNTDRSDLP